jgi:uncharacterized delta-60 repeat protein
MITKTSLPLLFGSLLAMAACGDDEGSGGAGGETSTTTGTGTTGPTSTTTSTKSSTSSATSSSSTGGGGGGGQQFMVPDPFAVPVSPAGPDQLQSVTAGPNDTFLAAGFVAQAVGGPRAVYVTKYTTTGADNTFGTMGVAVTPLVFVGGSDEIDITTQSDGKILVSATVANLTNPNDRDVAVIRLLDDGTIDATFGTAGIATINLNDAHDNGMMLVGMDTSRSITVDGDDNIFIHANSRALGTVMGGGPRTDTDFTVVKLTPNGSVDATFGEGGQFRLDIAQVNSTPRLIRTLPDGSVLASGYANTPDVGDTVQAVVYKLTPEGDLDLGFATAGLFHEPVLTIQTEIYGFALHGTNMVTAGYGRDTGDTNDYVSMRFDVDTGVRDITWGGTPNGAVLVDPSGMMLGSNARGAIGLPGGGTIIHGSTGPSNMPEQDAVFVVLDENGALDTSYLTGIHLFELGSNGNDQFWGGAVSGNFVSIVGYKGGGMTQTDMNNDDSYGIVFELMP